MTDSMAFLDYSPMIVPAEDVEMREVFAVPVVLRDHAHQVTRGEDPLGPWWTVGEFREGGEFATVVARRTPGGAVAYGVAE